MEIAVAENTLPDFAYKMAEHIINLVPGQAIRLKMNTARFALFRTCYVVADQATATSLFVNSFVIPALDWVSLRCYYQGAGIPEIETVEPLTRFPASVRDAYLAKLATTYTVVPYYTITHEGCIEEGDAAKSTPAMTHIADRFRDKYTLLRQSQTNFVGHTKLLDIVFKQMSSMQIVIGGTLQKSVCKYCENYFRAVAGMCHFRRCERDGTLDPRDNQGRLLCAMKIMFKSALDNIPDAVPAPYEVNLLDTLKSIGDN